jgi:hypothetical protein
MTRILNEWGFFNSHFRINAGDFTLLQSITEKIDNSYSANATEIIIGQKYKYIYIIDNSGMNKDNIKSYREFYRSNDINTEVRNDIGIHGLGGRLADYKLCNGIKTHVYTQRGRYKNGITFNYENMELEYNLRNKNPIEKNIYKIKDDIRERAKSYLDCHDIKNGTIFLYEYHDANDSIITIYNEITEQLNMLGVIYYKYLLNKDINIKYQDNFKGKIKEINYYDLLLTHKINELYPQLRDNNNKPIIKNYGYQIKYSKDKNDYVLIINLDTENVYYITEGGRCKLKNDMRYHQYKNVTKGVLQLHYFGSIKDKELKKITEYENEIFNTNLDGIMITRNDRMIGKTPYIPDKMTKKETKYYRGLINLETKEYDLIFNTSFNKSKLNMPRVIDRLLYFCLKDFIELREKKYIVNEINNSDNESDTDSVMDDTIDETFEYNTPISTPPLKKVSKRKNFTSDTINTVLRNQCSRCNILKIEFDANLYEKDHIDDDSSNNDDNNCQLIHPYIHAIKGRNRKYYDSIIDNPKSFLINEIKKLMDSELIKDEIPKSVIKHMKKLETKYPSSNL